MKKHIYISLFLIVMLAMTSCEEKKVQYTEPTISISKTGEISETLVESFDKDYYSIDELKSEIVQSISSYDTAASDSSAVVLNDAYVDNGNVYVVIDYNSCKSASEYGGYDIFYGTIELAKKNGYNVDAVLRTVEDGTLVNGRDIMSMDKHHLLIVNTRDVIVLPYKIVYYSANVELIDSNTARISSDLDGLAYIVTK